MVATASVPVHTFGEATLAELQATLRGTLLRPGDADYEAARRIWNHAIDKRPALIVRCAGVADVIRGVNFARSEGLPIALRGGSHSMPGFSTCDGGIVLDMSAMNAVRVDPQQRRAFAQPGATWVQFDHETQVHGLATTGGLISSTGVAGFCLGGGIGHLLRKAGLTCDNLLSADLVTADGELVRASADENADLFWGLRGGGGNFGVVTSFELSLHPVGPTVLGGAVFYPGEQAVEVVAGWRDAVAEAPDDLTTLISLTTAPPVPFLPESIHGKKAVSVVACWAGDTARGEAVVKPLRALGTPVADLLGPIPYVALQQLVDPLWGPGAANYFTSAFLDELPDRAVRDYAEAHQAAAGPPAACELHIHQAGGAMARVAPEATAFHERRAPYVINCLTRTQDAADLPPLVEWARATRDSMARYGHGRMYVNFTGDADEEKVRASYPPETYARLAQLKGRYDPDNVFRFNQNIRPAG